LRVQLVAQAIVGLLVNLALNRMVSLHIKVASRLDAPANPRAGRILAEMPSLNVLKLRSQVY
jgi:hypothetical protein